MRRMLCTAFFGRRSDLDLGQLMQLLSASEPTIVLVTF
jgi:hypothetical protein